MQSYGRGWMVPHATQNHQVYNARGYPQNQQSTMYMNYAPSYAPYLHNPLYLQHEPIGYMSYAPYPLYSQEEIRACLSQDPITNDNVLHDLQGQYNLFPNHYRKEAMPKYRNGEMVMVRCNKNKWLNGVIQRMSVQGMQIWIIDANISVNIPLVQLPTCVLKMTTCSTLESLPQVHPMWTIANYGGYQKVLIQCVHPAHLSHCQLLYGLDNNVCAICKLYISNIIDMVSPWNCNHQVHNHCLRLQMKQYSTIRCPSCNENFFHQLNLSKYSRFAHPNLSNSPQQFDLQCACGFKNAMIGNINAAIFCPNCHQPSNVNLMMINMQSGHVLNNMDINHTMVRIQNREFSPNTKLNSKTKRMQSIKQPLNMDLLHTFFESEKEIPESSKPSKILKKERFFNNQDFRFGWPMHSFSDHKRLEEIEEGHEVNTSSLESTTIEERHKESLYFPSYFQILNETFENNNTSYQNVFAKNSNDQDLQPPSHSKNSLQDGLLYEPFHTYSTKIHNKKDGSLGVLHPTPTTLIQSEWSNSQILLQDGLVDATLLSPTIPIQREQSNSQSSLQNDFKDAPLSTPSKSIKQLEMDKMTITTIEGHKLWKESEPNTIIATANDQNLEEKASQTITSIVDIEGPTIQKKANEIKIDYETIEDHKLKKRVSETFWNGEPSEGQKLEKKASEPNTTVATIKDQGLEKKVNETFTTIATSETNSLNMDITINERDTSWRMDAINCTKNLEDNEESEKLDKEDSSNDLVASSSIVAPIYINHFDGITKGQKLWKKISAVDWSKELVSDDDIKGRKETNSLMNPNNAPKYVNHFADFVKLAMGANSSIAKDIIASASASTSSSTLNSPLPEPLESMTSTMISPPPAFFTRASSLFTEAPTWIIHSKNSNEATSTSPTWITVIKDGVDSRKDDK